MKRLLAITVSLSFLVVAPQFAARGEDANEETQLISVLQSGQSLQEKDAACARLKWIGTARSVPALAELLTDGQLSHSARYALESMRGPEAGNALRQALAKTSGSNEVGIINSLGARGGTTAVPVVAALLSSADPEVAGAAAEALGKMGGDAALRALQGAWDGSSAGAACEAQSDGLLACANQLLTSGDQRQAAKIFKMLYDHEKNDGVRLAAFRGLILSSEKQGIVLMVEAIKGPDGPKQGAALQLASKVGGPATTAALASLLRKSPLPVQIALLQCLDQRGDRSAAPLVEVMLDNTQPDVRLAAIAALGDLGDGRFALRLARLAATTTGEERTAARQALVDLRQGPVTEALLKPLSAVPLDVQAEMIRALGDRGDSSAAPKLLELARGTNDATRSIALQALASVAEPAQVPGLIYLVVNATNDDTRSEAADALASACQHIQSHKARLDVTRLAQAVRTAPTAARVALLGVCSGVSDPWIREALLAAVSDPDARVRMAAIRALCASQDEQLLPDILKTACGAKEENFRMLGIRGCVRLITQEQTSPLTVAQKLDTLRAILKTTLNAEGKRQILSGLASVADTQSLDLAVSMLDDAEVRAEADEATLQIARAISVKHPDEAAAALNRVLAQPVDATVRKSARAALKKIKPAE